MRSLLEDGGCYTRRDIESFRRREQDDELLFANLKRGKRLSKGFSGYFKTYLEYCSFDLSRPVVPLVPRL